MNYLWGLDLGGTKIEGVILPGNGSIEPICRIRIPTEADQGYDHIDGQIARLVDMMAEPSGLDRPDHLGIGTPGALDRKTHLMKNANTTCLIGRPLGEDLNDRLGMRVTLSNDANCFALAEATLGAARGADVVFGVIMGTGVGGGLVVNSRALDGAQGIAGEWGHNVLEPGGRPCYCGKLGCVETVLAGPSLERFYEQEAGERRKLAEIVSLAATDTDPIATKTMNRLFEKFGEALSVVVNIVDPDVIVLGGGVGNVLDLYTKGRDSLAQWVFNDRLDTLLVRPTLGDSAGVFGAAMLTA